MKIWLPFVATGTGTDVFTRTLADSMVQRGHEVTTTAFSHGWQYVPWRLRLAQQPAGTDVVVANSWNAFAFKKDGIPLVSVEHHLVLDPAFAPYRSRAQAIFHNTLVRRFEQLSAKRADAVVAVSTFTAQQLRKHLGVAQPHVIYNGVDTDFFRPAARSEPISADRPTRLLFVGTLSRRKGADLLPAIVRHLGAGFELQFTGESRGNRFLRPGPGVVALGRLDEEELRRAYQEADLLLFPTRLEGLGLVAVEAMACGTPVVASRTGPLVEFVEDGTNGRLCPVDDTETFAQAIQELAADPDRLAAMGEAARRTVATTFSVDRMAEEYVELLTRLTQQAEG